MSQKYPLYLCAVTQSYSAGLCVGSRRQHEAETSSHSWARWSRCQEELLPFSLPSSRALCRQCDSSLRSTSMTTTTAVLHPAPRHCLCSGSLILTEKQLLDSPFLRNPTSLQSIAGLHSWVPSYLMLVCSQHPGSPPPSRVCHKLWLL